MYLFNLLSRVNTSVNILILRLFKTLFENKQFFSSGQLHAIALEDVSDLMRLFSAIKNHFERWTVRFGQVKLFKWNIKIEFIFAYKPYSNINVCSETLIILKPDRYEGLYPPVKSLYFPFIPNMTLILWLVRKQILSLTKVHTFL